MAELTTKSLKARVDAERERRDKLADRGAYMRGGKEAMLGKNGENWTGIRPPDAWDSAEREAMWVRIRQSFTQQNLLGACCSNHTYAVIGTDVDWELTLSLPKTQFDQVDAALTEWWETHHAQETLQQAVNTLQWATLRSDGILREKTSSLVRYYVPGKAVNETDENGYISRTVPPGPFKDVLGSAVRWMHPSPEQAGILRDADLEPIGAYYLFMQDDEQWLELHGTEREFVRQGWQTLGGNTEAQDMTIVQIRRGATFQDVVYEVRYPLGGELMIKEMSKAPLVTDDLFAIQNAHNAMWSYFVHSGESAFVWRVLGNVEPPPKNPDGSPGVIPAGSGTITRVTGNPIRGDTTNPGKITGYAPVTVSQFGVDPATPLIERLATTERAIYDGTNQLHRLITDDATANGVSRQQALGDYETSLLPTEAQIKDVVIWAVKIMCRLAAHFADERLQPYLEMSVTPSVFITPAPPTEAEQSLAITKWEKGIIDWSECMRRCGVTDVSKMQELVRAERGPTFGKYTPPPEALQNNGAPTPSETPEGSEQAPAPENPPAPTSRPGGTPGAPQPTITA